MCEYGWGGKKVAHDDGRTGVIGPVHESFGALALVIRVDGSTNTEEITLNSWGADSGATGRKWEFSPVHYPGQWAYLGDHNPK